MDIPSDERQRIKLTPLSDVYSAVFDPVLVRLALRNLLSNALAYSPKDKEVELAVAPAESPLGIAFEVRDVGCGISADEATAIFNRGVRGRAKSLRPQGAGWGLYIVRLVAERHGGHVSLRTNTPEGSVFQLFIPQGEQIY